MPRTPHHTPDPSHTTDAGGWSGGQVGVAGPMGGMGAGTAADGSGAPEQAASQLLLLLADCWQEAAPTLSDPQPEAAHVNVLVLCLMAANLLLANLPGLLAQEQGEGRAGAGGRSAVNYGGAKGKPVEVLLARVAPTFPVAMPEVAPAPALLDALVAFNLQASQLLVRMLPSHAKRVAAIPLQAGHTLARGSRAGVVVDAGWVASLVTFYEGVLEQGVLVPAVVPLAQPAHMSAATGSDPAPENGSRPSLKPVSTGSGHGSKNASRSVPRTKTENKPESTAGPEAGAGARAGAVAFGSVLSGVEAAVEVVEPEVAARLLRAVEGRMAQLPLRSTVRLPCLRLLHGLMRKWQQGLAVLPAALVTSWVAAMPKLLWQLGTASPAASAWALAMLHDAACFGLGPLLGCAAGEGAQGGAQGQGQGSVAEQLQGLLAPLFCIQLPPQGSAGRGSNPPSAPLPVAKAAATPVPTSPTQLWPT
ncbi:hypothetical protein V8C86DRAFT_698753 [Haematococcus lacustris]